MKMIKFTFLTLLIALILISCKKEKITNLNEENIRILTKKKTDPQKLAEINHNFTKVNSIKNWSKKIVKILWKSTEGGEATFFYSKNNLEKITEIYYGETGQNLTEYYFANHKLSFIFEKDIHYNRPITYIKEINKEVEDGVYFDFDKSEITVVRSYFYDDKLLSQISTNKSNVENKFSLKSEYLRLIKKLEFIEKIKE